MVSRRAHSFRIEWWTANVPPPAFWDFVEDMDPRPWAHVTSLVRRSALTHGVVDAVACPSTISIEFAYCRCLNLVC